MNRLLIFIDWYLPGFKAGGPIRSVANFVDHFRNTLDIFILTSDRDLGDADPYPGLQSNCWIRRDGYSVFYSRRGYLSAFRIRRIIREVSPKWIYINGMFSWKYSILPTAVSRYLFKDIRVLVAPRGMLKPTALKYNQFVKKIYLGVAKLAGLYKIAIFQATSEDEEQEIAEAIGINSHRIFLRNLPGNQRTFLPVSNKKVGELRLIWVGRIHPIKNLHLLLEWLSGVSNPRLNLTIVGNVEDDLYWKQCRKLIASSGIGISIVEDVPNDKIYDLLSVNHIFVLMTSGENFGHAIFESLSVGRPVLISDRTPWTNLSKYSAGWDISLSDDSSFLKVIEICLSMTEEEINKWALGAWTFASDIIFSYEKDKRSYEKLLTA